MNNRIVFGMAFATILLVGLVSTSVIAERPNETVTLDGNQEPMVDSPIDIVYVEGTTGHSISWEISDDDPAYYVIFKNGNQIAVESWVTNNETVIVDIDGLLAGNYEYMILISDSHTNVTDLVLVSVLSLDIEVHDPVSIYGNTDFNDTAQAEGWIGNGSISDPFIIEKLYIESSYTAIAIYQTSVHFIIQNCTLVGDASDYSRGVDFQGVSNGAIINCTFANLWMGCMVWTGINCTWDDNSFGNIGDGLWINNGLDCTITNNNFQSGGISFAGYVKENWLHVVSGNVMQGRPIGYLQGLISQDIDAGAYGQIVIANCSNVKAMNGQFTDVGVPISIGFSNSCGAYDCIFEDGRYAVYVENSYDTKIHSCEIYGMSEYGLYINMTDLNEIIDCTIKNAEYTGASIGMAPNTTIIGCTFSSCGGSALSIWESPYLVLMDSVLDNNYGSGLSMGGCPDSLVRNNTFRWNDQYGIEIWWDCDGSYFYENTIGYNSLGNANDDGSGTFWDDGVSNGNMWSDYYGTGYYYVPGSRGGVDHYPEGYSEDYLIEILDLTSDITYVLGTTGHKIIWYPNCTHPLQFTIFKDGVSIVHLAWDGYQIEHNVDGLPLGTYNYTLEIMDTFNQTASHTVWVEVISGPTTTSGSTTIITTNGTTTSNGTATGGFEQITLVISIGSTAIIIVVIVLMLRTKKNV